MISITYGRVGRAHHDSFKERSIFRLGVFGGTFNPVHFGHLRSAEEIREQLGLDRVLFVTSARPPHKKNLWEVSFHHRHRMLELALEGEVHFAASDLENQRPGRSYSIETLKQLRTEFGPGASFYFIVGMDSFLEITTWKNYRELFEHSAFAVMDRPGFDGEELETVIKKSVSSEYHFSARDNAYIHPRFQSINYCRTTLLDISSTRIRQAVAGNRSVRFLLPERVERYILEKGLYKE